GLRFIFAPFGGLASVSLEEERLPGDGPDAPVTRLGYVKLRNEAAMEKAVANLHQTRVGDGDLVEECIVECRQWHPRGWSDGSFLSSFFVDQLPMSRRPTEPLPGPDDAELYVKNLPLQDMDRQQLVEYFEGFGEVEDLLLIRDHFTAEPTGEGYVRFKNHRDAQRCIEALTPGDGDEVDPMDLTGRWSESERALQKKANCYRFNVVAELVGADGSGLDRLKKEAKLKSFWVLAECLTQKDRLAPAPDGRQLHFAARCPDEASARAFRDLLEKTLEETHARISDRMEKRKRKAQELVAAPAEKKAPAQPRSSAEAPNGQPPWHAPPAAGGWPQAGSGWGGGWGGAWQGAPATAGSGGAAPPPGYPGYPGPGGAPPWAAPPAPAPAPPAGAAPAGPSVFEQRAQGAAQEKDGDKRQSRSRRRKHHRKDGAENKDVAEKERRHRSGSRKRRRRRGEEPAARRGSGARLRRAD
ncbi:unnamed protein product, partial [Prorocentrum cordatum]